MKEKWLEDIQSRMADYEVEEPQGLWEDILKAQATVKPRPGSAIRFWMWGAAAAACLTLGLGLGMLTKHDHGTNDVTSPGALAHQNIAMDDKGEDLKEESPDRPLARRTTQGDSRNRMMEIRESMMPAPSNGEDSPGSIPEDSSQVEIPEKQSTESPSKALMPSRRSQEKENRHQYLALNTRKDSNKGRLSIGLSSSGGLGTNYRLLYPGSLLGAGAISSDAEWKDSPLLGIMYLNRGIDTQRKVTHHAPIRTMLSLSYPLSERWQLESGISYAMVASSTREGSSVNYIRDEVRLHYVGVPLGISYRALSWKRFDLYLSSDVLAELMASGKTTRNFILTGEQSQKEVIPVTSHPLQMSLGTKIGAQYNISSNLSLFAEPGCRYYFDDGSSIQTVFKEHKLDFNLSMGLRVTVGR